MPVASVPGKEKQARRRFVVIHNTWAGKADRQLLEAVFQELHASGCNTEIYATAGQSGVGKALATANLATAEAIVVAGGDGTVNAAVKSLVSMPDINTGNRSIPIGVVPLGTANVIAHELELPARPADLAHVLMYGGARQCTLARLGSEVFVVMGTAGFDAHVVGLVTPELKRRLGKGAYWYHIVGQAIRYAFPLMEVKIDDRTETAAAIAVMNGARYGGNHVVLPQANLETPGLYVILMRRPGTWNMLRYLAAAWRGVLADLDDVSVIEAHHSVRIENPRNLPFQADGNIIGTTPLEIEIAPRSVMLLGPQTLAT